MHNPCCHRKIEVRMEDAPGIAQGRGSRVSAEAATALVTVENGNWGATQGIVSSIREIRSLRSPPHLPGSSGGPVLSSKGWRPPREFCPTRSGEPTRRSDMRGPLEPRSSGRNLDGQRPYQIRLSARELFLYVSFLLHPCYKNRFWSQYVYQFSHELCHVTVVVVDPTSIVTSGTSTDGSTRASASSLPCSSCIVWLSSGKQSHRTPSLTQPDSRPITRRTPSESRHDILG